MPVKASEPCRLAPSRPTFVPAGRGQSLAGDLVEEAPRRRHRAHRMRTGRTDPDLEQVENRKKHVQSSMNTGARVTRTFATYRSFGHHG